MDIVRNSKKKEKKNKGKNPDNWNEEKISKES